MTGAVDSDDDLSPELRFGDVLISPRHTRWTFVRWSPRGKLVCVNTNGKEQGWWWRYRSNLPKGWAIERDGIILH